MKNSKSFKNLIGLVIALLTLFFVFNHFIPDGRFSAGENIELMARQSVIVCLLSLGMTFVIISGGIDLSVGSIAACASVTVAAILAWTHLGPSAALLLGIATGLFCGLVNGTLITKINLSPFIVTLSSYLIVRAAAKGIAHEQAIPGPESWIDSLLSSVPRSRSWQILPTGVWITILLALLMAFILKYTRFGRHIISIGSNEAAARLCGVPVNRVKFFVYVISGAFAGLAGVMLYSRLVEGDPTAAMGIELNAIAAVVIGGASLSGGEGSIGGALLGALIMQVVSSGAAQIGWANWVQEIVTGLIILLAVGLDRWRVRRAQLST